MSRCTEKEWTWTQYIFYLVRYRVGCVPYLRICLVRLIRVGCAKKKLLIFDVRDVLTRNCGHCKATWWAGWWKCHVKARNLMSTEWCECVVGCNESCTTKLTSAANSSCRQEVPISNVPRLVGNGCENSLKSARSVRACHFRRGTLCLHFFQFSKVDMMLWLCRPAVVHIG